MGGILEVGRVLLCEAPAGKGGCMWACPESGIFAACRAGVRGALHESALHSAYCHCWGRASPVSQLSGNEGEPEKLRISCLHQGTVIPSLVEVFLHFIGKSRIYLNCSVHSNCNIIVNNLKNMMLS